MGSLFQHLRVLLWKNWLSVKRQPLWSFMLITWPVFSFILLAIIRIKFPPEPQPNCYLAPRNLPSAGFFPFLETVLCSSDATCKSTAYKPEDLLPKINGIPPLMSRKQRRSANPEKDSNPSSQTADVPKSRNGSLELINSTFDLEGHVENISLSARIHLLDKILSLAEKQKSSVADLKAELCEAMTTNVPAQSLLWEVFGRNIYQTFCFNNMSLVESFFQEFRNQMSKLQNDPQYQVAFVKETISFFSLVSQVQNETSLWSTLLLIPDTTQGIISVKDMVAALQNTSRKILSADFMSEDWALEAGHLSKEFSKRMNMILQLLKNMQEKISTADLKNLGLFRQEGNSLKTRWAEILQWQMEDGRDKSFRELLNKHEINKLHNLTSLLLQNGFKVMPLFNKMTNVKEIQEVHNFVRSSWNLFFSNKTNFKGTDAWQTIRMLASHNFPYTSEKLERYLTSLQDVQSLFENFLLKPTTMENIPEKLQTLQEIFDIIANVNTSHNYLLMSTMTRMMQKIQNFLGESLWNEFNTYWRIAEILRSEKWSDKDIVVYGQVLDILHNNLHVPHNVSDRPLKRELEHLIQYVNRLLKEHGVEGANVTMALDTILKTLHVLEDLEEKYINELRTVNPLMQVDNGTVQGLFQIFKEGVDILSDSRLTGASGITKIDTLLRFSHILLVHELYGAPKWQNSSVEENVLELLYLTLSPFLREDIQDKEKLANCTVKDFHLITVEVLLNNATLKEALRSSSCYLLFTSMDSENETTHHHTFAELFEPALRNVKDLLASNTHLKNKKKYFSNEFQCLVKSLKLSSGFLSKLNSFYNYKNLWIQKMHKSLTAISNELSQSNETCQLPLFGSMDVRNESSALHILSRFMLNETETYVPNVSGNSSVWNHALASFISLYGEPHKNAIVSKLLEVSKNAAKDSKWENFSKVFSEVTIMLRSNQNVTNTEQYVQLLEKTRKALILVVAALAPNESLETLSWGMKASNLKEALGLFKLPLNTTSDIDYKTYLGNILNTFSPPIDVLAESLLYYMNPYWEETKDALKLAEAIRKRLFLNNTNVKLATLLETIQKVTSFATPLFPESMQWDFNATQETPLPFSDFLMNSVTTKDILEELSAFQNDYYSETNQNMTDYYPLTTHVAKIMQVIQNVTNKSWGHVSTAIREQLRFLKADSRNLDTYTHILNTLHKYLSSQDINSLELERLTRILSHALQKYEHPQSNISDTINTILRNLLDQESVEHQFNISQFEAIFSLPNDSNKTIQRIHDILRQGIVILSDRRLAEETNTGKISALYNFSHFLFPKEFESLLGHSSLAESQIAEILHLSLNLFLDIRNRRKGSPENCTAQELFDTILERLFKNGALQESLKQSRCELLFTSMDFENQTMPNQTFTELFQLSISNLDQMPELANIYINNNEHFSSSLLCIIKSLQFSSAFLSQMDNLFHFKHPWIQKSYETLTAISKELPPSNATCPSPGLGVIDNVLKYDPLKTVHPFLTNEAEINQQNFTGKLTDYRNWSDYFRLLQNKRLHPSVNDSGWSNLSQIWSLVSQWNLTEKEYTQFGLKLVERLLGQNMSAPEVLATDAYMVQKGMFLDLLKELKRGLDQHFLSNRNNVEYEFDHVTHPFVLTEETFLNKILLRNQRRQAPPPSSLVARFLFAEFENVFIQMSPNNDFRSYLICLMNVTEKQESELTENSARMLKIAQLESVLLSPHDTYKKYSMVSEILMSRLAHLQNLTSLLCDSERIKSLQQTCQLPDVNFVELCDESEYHKKLLHHLERSDHVVTNSINRRSVSAEFKEMLIGNPQKLQQQIVWLQENVPKLQYFQDISAYMASLNSILNITKNITHSRKQDMLIDLFRNEDSLRNDLRSVVGMSEESINALLEMPLPENRTQLIFQILQLEFCYVDATDAKLEVVAKEFCHLSLTERAHKSYLLGVTFLHYLDVYNFMYKMFSPKELQISLDQVFDLLKELNHFKKKVISDVHPLLDAIHSLKKLRQSRNAPFSKALNQASNLTLNTGTLKTLSKVFCNQEITPLYFQPLLPDFGEQNVHHSSAQDERVQNIMKKYGIPQDSSQFCLSFFLDLVSTPTGALIWSFLKPMLLGRILYTPDTQETRAIMEKSNSTLKLMADLTQKSQEWLDSSPLLMDSLAMLNETVPVVKNALRNPFVQVFIKLMVKLDAVDLLHQIDELDDIRLELQDNADIINQLSILAGLAVNVSSCVLFDRIQPHKTVEEMEMVAKDLFLKNELFASVIFKLPSKRTRREREILGELSLPPLVNYTIRMSSKISQTTRRIREKIWTVGPHNSASQSQIYSRAFVYIQDSIDRAIIELQTGKNAEEIAVQVQAMPYPCYNKDMFLTSVTYSLPFTLMAAWILFIATFVKKLVQEKDLRLYEYMKMMGVNSSSHFFAWFIECATFLLITITFLIIILKVGNVLPKINAVILFLYLVDYSFSIIAMCYLISVFFNNTNIAALVACLVYILTFFPFMVLLVVENHVSFSVKSLLSLLSPTAFSYASQYIARYEEQGIGLQWDNMYSSPMLGDDTNFCWMCWLILMDSFIYLILGWYIRKVFPGKYGMAAPWYFPLLPSYWAECCGYNPLWSEKTKDYFFRDFFFRKQPEFPEKMYTQSALPSNLEPEPTNLKVGVSLHGITKIYESKAAVQNLSLNFYEGNITSLLGHNGAGKTTTISILTGLFPASSGTIYVYGKDIRTDQDSIRKNMGICMQHNVLFSYLTTKEHLFLYGYIKVPHWSKEELQKEIERTLKETGLYSHRHKLAGSLSGGMKRKLSISIALLGGSKVVILDEPTTGVDPCSRRGIWEIISKNRKGRTIILSTHHLDEAEVLSDRIAFLEHGGLKCCGSPFYLKETFGNGYHLILTKKKGPTLNVAEECDTSAVTAMIQSHLPEAYLKEDIGGELVYVLPKFNSKVSSAYQSLLRGLDNGLSDLHIGCYGISDSTVEEVFLNLTKDMAKDEPVDDGSSKDASSYTPENEVFSISSDSFTERDDQALVQLKKSSNFSVLMRRSTALFIKRFHHTRRNVKGFIAQVILPLLFVTAAMGLRTLGPKVAEYPALLLSPSMYGSSNQADFFGNHNETTNVLVESLLSFPGADNTCLNNSNLACFKEDVPSKWVFSGNQSAQYSVCNCTDDRQTCPKINFPPPHKRSFFFRTIYNLTGHDVETYLLATTKDFMQKRYGGWSFGLPLTSDLQFDIRPVPTNRTITKVWYNPEGYHSLPAYLNSLNNIILRANLPKEKSFEYGISVVAHPYPGGESQEQVMLNGLLDLIVSMCVLIGYSITTSSFVLYVVKEHQNKAKQLQHISGMGVKTYWVTNFIYDLVYFLVPVTLSVGIISVFQIPAFFNDSNLLAVTLLLILFGYSTFSWMYLLAGIFKETGMAFIVYVCINLFFGINTINTHSTVLELAHEKQEQGLLDLAETLRHVFLIFPQFCFGYGLIELSYHEALMGFLKAYGVVCPDRTFDLDRISSKLLGMFIQGTIFFSIRLLIDDGTIHKVWHKILEFLFNKVHGETPLQLDAVDEKEDKDVQAERERVTLGLTDCDMLQLQNLTKVYHLLHRRISAVKNVSVGIPAGECFGLLGVNGAGKTTIFKMLTGDIGPSGGRLLVRDETGSLNDINNSHWSLFGYCPQDDALDDLLTVEEHMYYYARLHGIPEKHIKGVVFHLLYRLNLMPYKHRITSMCSYGTNRKLSTALALLGKPSILLLDEPSSGMDPNAKRHLWKIITEEVQNQCSVILTSHSMEECEALCTRLAIMVNGRFQCMGSLQHIKSRFGKGFTVKLHLNNELDSIEKLTQFLQSNFPNTHLKDHQLNMAEYHVPMSAGGVANIFQLLETNKQKFNIRHFSVSQTTLEEVFINFAKAQTGPDILDTRSDTGSESSDLSSQDANIIAIC
ncbi:glucosylceramide transporter ABCA12 isoform X1 [Anolis carolinensis]|uniref:glucosylceramide transporter ABCA12 isoform X1 n=2 Tax=Anolis carolinensis TaxID=28377 RepID=UPI002F2B21E9